MTFAYGLLWLVHIIDLKDFILSKYVHLSILEAIWNHMQWLLQQMSVNLEWLTTYHLRNPDKELFKNALFKKNYAKKS